MGCSISKAKVHDERNLVKKTFSSEWLGNHPKRVRTESQEFWVSEKSMLTNTSTTTFYTLAGTFNEKVEALKGSEIAFHFDTVKLKFICYNFVTKKWSVNDLTQAKTLNITNLLDEGFDVERDLISRLDCYSLLAIDENKIEIVGPSHFQYHISLNYFLTRPSMSIKGLKAPCLTFSGRRLFAISGEQNNEYIPSAEVYDMNSKNWNRIEELSQPHGKGLSCCFLSDRKLLKVLVVGGYRAKNPLCPSNEVAIYDEPSKNWLSFEFNKVDIPTLPALIDATIYISEGGLINIQQTKGSADYYQLNLSKGHLTKVRSINRIVENIGLEILKISPLINEKEIGFLFGTRNSINSNIKLTQFKKTGSEYYITTTPLSIEKWSQLVPIPKKLT